MRSNNSRCQVFRRCRRDGHREIAQPFYRAELWLLPFFVAGLSLLVLGAWFGEGINKATLWVLLAILGAAVLYIVLAYRDGGDMSSNSRFVSDAYASALRASFSAPQRVA